MHRRSRLILTGVAVLLGVATLAVLLGVAQYGMGPLAKRSSEASYGDLARMDDLADEYGLVMTRSHGPAENFAARIDGPGSEVDVLVAEGNSFDGDAVVVLRLTTEHHADGLHLMGDSGADGTTRSACYRWTFESSIHDHEPERMDDCPPGPVLTVTPTPGPTYDGG